MATPEEKLAAAIGRLADVHDEQLGAIAKAVDRLATQLKNLGYADATTPMGALEAASLEIEEGLSSIANAIRDHE